MKQLIESLDAHISWHWLAPLSSWTVEQAVELQQIPGPTFAEEQRAQWMAERFQRLNLDEVHIDNLFNVYGVLRGLNAGDVGLLVSAHTDTVFAADTDLTVLRAGTIIRGPGIGDNSIGAAALLSLVEGIRRSGIVPVRDIWLCATSREEGLGDLGGMRSAFNRLRDRIDTVINVEGQAFGHIYHAGIAVRRLHITATAPGGHSWLHFGRPTATHAVLKLGAQITAIEPPTAPRTTYNIGMIEGGEAINAIASHAGLWLDLRSEDPDALAALEKTVRSCVETAQNGEISWNIELVGDRPAGRISSSHDLVQAAIAALARVGVRATLETGSTDANIPLSCGVPAVTIGITRGGNAHRLDEYIETEAIPSGLRQLILLTLAAAS